MKPMNEKCVKELISCFRHRGRRLENARVYVTGTWGWLAMQLGRYPRFLVLHDGKVYIETNLEWTLQEVSEELAFEILRRLAE